jgi:8-oxo-dGTP diphosphatase
VAQPQKRVRPRATLIPTNARPALTVDGVVFSMRHDGLVVLLVRRKYAPFKGAYALPGGLVNANEPLRKACLRELEGETGVSNVRLEQLGAFGDPGRDPRGHTVSVVFFGFVLAEGTPLRAGDDASEASWHELTEIFPKRGSKRPRAILELAFDHRGIIAEAYKRLVESLRDPARLATFDLVPENFTLAQLFQVYEGVLHRPINRRGFAKKLADLKLIEAVGDQSPARKKRTLKGSAARTQLYRWNQRGT